MKLVDITPPDLDGKRWEITISNFDIGNQPFPDEPTAYRQLRALSDICGGVEAHQTVLTCLTRIGRNRALKYHIVNANGKTLCGDWVNERAHEVLIDWDNRDLSLVSQMICHSCERLKP